MGKFIVLGVLFLFFVWFDVCYLFPFSPGGGLLSGGGFRRIFFEPGIVFDWVTRMTTMGWSLMSMSGPAMC